ncbi:MAG TPA: GNAT family N-acetyltransferase [Acetobacteraceae bacterium]|jgi:ribosomal-protein-alanine N-acetyltransferase|nr:GNAT family N-acetyltransferase [Acetobacteraceae bacterium]
MAVDKTVGDSRRQVDHGASRCDAARVENRFMRIETTRLILRPPALTDIPDLFGFLGDAKAMRYTHADASPRACRRRIAVHEWRRRRDGYAPWAIVTKATGQLIGWGGLYQDPFDPGWGVEVGYFFHPSAWGRGYASELAAACTEVADDVLKLPKISAFAHADNLGSRRVLEKTGFEAVRIVPEMERLLYRRNRGGLRSVA